MTSTTRTTDGRDVHARAILGPELYSRLPQTKLLLVGAGGIGCELLKNIVLTGFGHITLLDLDTIDLSNLNRQFLFKKKDVKQSKALIAARTASAFNPNVHITPIHGNIKEPQFDVTWFAGFDIVLNALDNLDARRHVNKMCMAANVPLVESGTAGYLGQVQPILKDRTECFDCVPKPTPKTFPVCTIRSTPSQPIHCIVWAKSYLMPQLFGEDEDSMGELDEAEKQGENAQEIATLRKEASAFKTVRAALRDAGAQGQASAARTVFEKVFHSDIVNLLSMADMWRSRAPPTPLDFDAIRDGAFTITRDAQPNGAPAASGSSANPPGEAAKANGSAGAEKMLNGSANGEGSSGAGLKDQRALSLQDNLELFVSSTERLAARLCAGEDTISFDKDDDDTLDFVTAASNLRSIAYGIPGKSRWEVKEMAGNIIPAIATTNAIIAGLIVLQAFHLLRKSYSALRNVHVQFKPSMPLSSINMSTPSPACGVCKDTYTTVRVDPARVTLGDVVRGVLGGGPGSAEGGIGRREVSVYEDKRVLADPDWDENCEKTLESLGVTRGRFLTIVDEEEEYGTIQVAIAAPAADSAADADGRSWLPDTLPVPLKKKRAAPPPSTPPPSSLKRPAPDDDVLEVESSSKRLRANDAAIQFSPNKKRRLDEDGLILLEKQDESLEDDVIVLD